MSGNRVPSSRTSLSPLFRQAVVLSFFGLVILSAGCSDDDPTQPDDPYIRGNTPAEILEDFRLSWTRREVHEYAALLSDDFRFYFDPDTRSEKGLPEFWLKPQDSTQVGLLFASDQVSDVRLDLTFVPTPVADARPGWSLINVTDETFEVDLKPQPGEEEGVTLLVEGQIHKFYFRKGRTEADTLLSFPTSQKYYIVEWRDMGRQLAPEQLLATKESTWGGIKAIFNGSAVAYELASTKSSTWGSIKSRY